MEVIDYKQKTERHNHLFSEVIGDSDVFPEVDDLNKIKISWFVSLNIFKHAFVKYGLVYQQLDASFSFFVNSRPDISTLNEPSPYRVITSVPRLGDLLDFGQLFKPLEAINLPKSPTFLGNFCKGVKIYHFSSEIIFGQL